MEQETANLLRSKSWLESKRFLMAILGGVAICSLLAIQVAAIHRFPSLSNEISAAVDKAVDNIMYIVMTYVAGDTIYSIARQSSVKAAVTQTPLIENMEARNVNVTNPPSNSPSSVDGINYQITTDRRDERASQMGTPSLSGVKPIQGIGNVVDSNAIDLPEDREWPQGGVPSE